ncbi:MAG: YiiX/YebB-like N1pC/P60 family cysteine hydrolase, partial [Candidatus Omnitrophota bacterium]
MKDSASQKQYSIKNHALIGVLILGITNILYQAPRSYALTVAKAKMIRYTDNMDIQEGDFIFQHLPGPLTEMIAAVTQSAYSHCGIVVRKTDRWFVLEAIEPVTWTPLNKWIARGEGAHVTLVRLKPQYRRYIPQIIQEAEHYVGRPYDLQYQWDETAIYCSELIYKAVWKGAGIRLADFVRLGELNWRLYEPLIRSLAGGRLPLDRLMITPNDLVHSGAVVMVYSSFPAREI